MTKQVDEILKRALANANEHLPSEEITRTEMMENLAYAKRMRGKNMSNLIKRVARALGGDEFDYPNDRERFMRDARAAIEAMREPTPEMLEAVQNWKGQQSYTDIWKAMIDAALPHC